jgi:outer membrane protein
MGRCADSGRLYAYSGCFVFPKGDGMTRTNISISGAALLILAVALSHLCAAQASDKGGSASLPSAPQPQASQNAVGASASGNVPAKNRTALNIIFPTNGPQTSYSGDQAGAPVQPPANGVIRLTRIDAEKLAIKNNPQISVGKLLALAQHQVYRETRASELPTFNGSITAADANEGSRIGAGSLTDSRLFEHAGAGVTLTQFLTDFGRTLNLVSSAKLQEKAQNANVIATTEDIVLATDQAFYNALQAEALLKVARQTVATRGSVEHQVDELTKSQLKSTLDLTFAQVNLSQAKLLELDAKSNVESTIAALTAVLGFDKNMGFELVEENDAAPPPPPPNVDVLINAALQQRPDLQAVTFKAEAAEKFHRAQRDQLLPTISALGIAGATPVRPDCIDGCFPNYFISSWYGAIGVNMEIPIFNGFLFTSEASEAKYRAKAASENTRNLRDNVVRDVRTAWLSASTAFQKVGVTAELAKEANLSLTLAQGRYQLGLSSIVELSQAQLQQTEAAISYVNAQYQYQMALSTLNFEIGTQP